MAERISAAPFACPECGGGLAEVGGEGLDCANCRVRFPVRAGIARFVSSDNYAASFGFQWLAHARTQLDSHSGLPISEARFFDATRWPRDLSGQRVLEAGSGAGRFTEILCGTRAEVFSFDYSEAVEANFKNNSRFGNLRLFQGDIFRVPFPPASFDRVCCLGVLQHTPDPAAAFRSLVRCLRPGGWIAIDVYRKSFAALCSWKYLLRPMTTRVDPTRLYGAVRSVVSAALPLAVLLRRVGGRFGARLVPIVEYSHLGLSRQANREWSVLDTFDMYAPKHDHPQSVQTVRRWFEGAGLRDIEVAPGANGVVGRGRRPSSS